ncbi:hypothetical protein NF27_EY01050 [Candidatus Jidaibacter acanthamoeba]|uniref:Uncharacterized protein n=1 Tax=Candidatus Jidaibacter acanthamoebae TaxID=86105 RepID=A0A0C1QHM8_9RICK|nr:hypothetical protein [Candidatus Jidaibacter acanthamoeba]KIE05009.1 hypothetical protein NF27_EY01050 [Candidatus Jidaibacter acanthamoeba]
MKELLNTITQEKENDAFVNWAVSLSVPCGIVSVTFIPFAIFSDVARFISIVTGTLYIGAMVAELAIKKDYIYFSPTQTTIAPIIGISNSQDFDPEIFDYYNQSLSNQGTGDS